MEAYNEVINALNEELARDGVFLMAGKNNPNPMTIGWCQIGRLWGQPVCTVYVRPSRYSHELIENEGIFSVSIPKLGTMKDELIFCGTKSGRDVNKLNELGLCVTPNRAGGVDVLSSGCVAHIECEVIGKAELTLGLTYIDESLKNRFYNPAKEAGESGDYHTVYYGRILGAYLI